MNIAHSVANLTYVALPFHALILVRAAQTRLWRTYPFFYFPLACSLIGAVILYWIGFRHPALYFGWYWRVQVVTMLLACGTLLELSRKGFCRRGQAGWRTGRSIYYLVYVIAASAGLIYVVFFQNLPRTKATQVAMVVFERDFRVFQALVLLVLLAAVLYFGVPLGRNLTGILLGYGIYIGSSLITLEFESRFGSFHDIWAILQPWSYVASLVIYLVCLWSYRPADFAILVSQGTRKGVLTTIRTVDA